MRQSDYARAKWDKKHKERLEDMADPLPNERLKNLTPTVLGGTALDLACGLGGNSLFLAEQGYVVEAVDISETAIGFVRELAMKRGLNVHASVMDLTNLENLPFKNGTYDLIVITNYLDRALFPYLKRLLKEGGHFFMETYYDSPNKAGGKVSEQFRLKPNELLEQFGEWEVLFFEESELEGRQIIFCRKPGLL
ncbi:class I SAM-dependent methyltransferase [Neobacillus sp. SCS-31]|uniref:class I SAM-dependent methyltransferase n=1 Tax=Neobacillus oceani TaxID=3115292 RepID=UPI003906D342